MAMIEIRDKGNNNTEYESKEKQVLRFIVRQFPSQAAATDLPRSHHEPKRATHTNALIHTKHFLRRQPGSVTLGRSSSTHTGSKIRLPALLCAGCKTRPDSRCTNTRLSLGQEPSSAAERRGVVLVERGDNGIAALSDGSRSRAGLDFLEILRVEGQVLHVAGALAGVAVAVAAEVVLVVLEAAGFEEHDGDERGLHSGFGDAVFLEGGGDGGGGAIRIGAFVRACFGCGSVAVGRLWVDGDELLCGDWAYTAS